MPRCSNCENKWTWGTTIRKSFTLGEGMECPICGKTQYLTKNSRKKMGFMNFFPPAILLGSAWLFELEIISVLAIAFLLFAIFITIYPQMTELTNENEPMW